MSSLQPELPALSSAVSWPRRGLWFAVVGIVIGASFFLDAGVREWVLLHQNPVATEVAHRISDLASGFFVIPLCVVGGTAAWLRRSRLWTGIMIGLLLSFVLSGILVNLLRGTTGRTRPRATAPQGWYGPYYDSRWLLSNHQFNSFPSGHTAAAMGLSGIFVCGLRRHRFAAVTYGVLVG